MKDIPENTSLEVAWLHYVAGMTQAEIANQRGMSKATVHRLLRAAHASGAVCVFVGERPDVAVELELHMTRAFGLERCRLVPSVITEDKAIQNGVASLAAQSLMARLDADNTGVIGLGAGRALAGMARVFPRIRHPNAEFVSLTGDFSVFRTGHSTDVIRRLADRTGGTGYAIAAPMVANTAADRDVLASQDGTRIAFEKVEAAETAYVGIGHLGEGSFLTTFNLVTPQELENLRRIGVVADFCGTLLNADGDPVDCAVGKRMLACPFDSLLKKRITAVVHGIAKVPAILAALNRGILTEIISDVATAKALLKNVNIP